MKYFVRWMCIVCLNGLLFLQAACAAQQTNIPARVLSPDGENTYAYLLMDSAVRAADYATAGVAANMLLQTDPSEQIAMQTATILLYQQELAQAATVAQENFARYPDSFGLARILAECYYQQGNPQAAIDILTTFLTTHSDNTYIHEQLFELLAEGSQHAELISMYSKLPAQQRTTALQFIYAYSLTESGRFFEAKKELQQIAKENPTVVNVWVALLRIAQEEKDYENVQRYYSQCQRLTPQDYSWSLRTVAFFLEEKQVTRAASVVRDMANTLEEKQLPVLLQATDLFIAAKYLAEAEELLQHFEKKSGAPDSVLFYRAYFLYEVKKDIVAAEVLLAKVSAASSLYVDSLRMRVQMLLEMDRPNDALSLADEVLETRPNDTELVLFMAYIISTNDSIDAKAKLTKALALLDTALEANPDNVPLLFGKGSILTDQGDFEAATVLMERVIVLAPEHSQALNNVGYLLADTNQDLERALDYIQRALVIEPDSSYILDSLAWVYYRMGNMDAAWQFIQMSIERSAVVDSVVWEHYGDIAKAVGNSEEAKLGYNNALTSGHGNPDSIHQKLSGVR